MSLVSHRSSGNPFNPGSRRLTKQGPTTLTIQGPCSQYTAPVPDMFKRHIFMTSSVNLRQSYEDNTKSSFMKKHIIYVCIVTKNLLLSQFLHKNPIK